MPQPVLYTNPRSRGRTARWMLEELGVPYEVVTLGYGEAMRTAEYLALNPMAKVPTLVHGDQVVTETPAILAYLADAFPDAGLAPPPAARGAYYRWLFFAAGPLEAAMTDRALGVQVPAEKQGFVGYGDFDRVRDALVQALDGRRFVAGERFSAADVYLGAMVGYALQFGSLEPHPVLAAYAQAHAQRPARLRAAALDDAAEAAP